MYLYIMKGGGGGLLEGGGLHERVRYMDQVFRFDKTLPLVEMLMMFCYETRLN